MTGPEHIRAILPRVLPALHTCASRPRHVSSAMPKNTHTVPLIRACQELRLSREIVMRRIIDGTLEATQAPNGRWYVTQESLDRAKEGR